MQEKLAQINLRLGNPPKGDANDPNPSPQFVMEEQTGLTPKGVGFALKVSRKERPDLIPAIEGYQKMLEEGEGTESPELIALIQHIKGLRQRRPELFAAVHVAGPVKTFSQGQPSSSKQ